VISIELPAKAVCQEPECTHWAPVTLSLTPSGGFNFSGLPQDWGVAYDQKNPFIPFQTVCPEHKPRVQIGPSGPRIVSPH
jgi:hypothetical protein